MSNPIETLKGEHRLIEKVLGSLEGFLAGLSGSDPDGRETLGRYAEFFREFADRCHHGKEEVLLFGALERHGMPRESGPLAVMRHEHELGRALVRKLAAVAEGAGELSAHDKQTVKGAGTEYIVLLRAHIMKEDNVLFVAAANMLPPEALEELNENFSAFEREQMGEGIHDGLHRLAEELTAAHPSLAGR